MRYHEIFLENLRSVGKLLHDYLEDLFGKYMVFVQTHREMFKIAYLLVYLFEYMDD